MVAAPIFNPKVISDVAFNQANMVMVNPFITCNYTIVTTVYLV